MLVRSLIVILMLFYSSIHLWAQEDTTVVGFQSWMDLTTIHEFNDKWIYSGDYGIRGAISSDDWTTFYARPTIRYIASLKLDVRSGISLFYTAEELLESQAELRFHQQANLKWPKLSDWIMTHMLRFEERFFFYKRLENDFSARGRYRISLETPDIKLFGMKRSFYGLTSLELFIPLGDQSVERFVNNNRIVVGIGLRTSNMLKFEMHYIFQNSRIYETDNFQTAEHVLRIRVFLVTRQADPVEP